MKTKWSNYEYFKKQQKLLLRNGEITINEYEKIMKDYITRKKL